MNEGKPSCFCAAHGCNQLGTMTSSTSGSDEWWCFMHFGKDAVKLQSITVEINRREWLSQAITSIRRFYGSEAWADTFRLAQHDFAINQRNDLKIGNDETVWEWVLRLEKELEAMCSSTFTKPPKQVRIETDEPMKKVQFEVPEPA